MRISIDLDDESIRELEEISSKNDAAIEDTIVNILKNYLFKIDETYISIGKISHQLLIPIQSMLGSLYYIENEIKDQSLKLRIKENVNELKKLSYFADNIRKMELNKNIKVDYSFKEVDILKIVQEASVLFKKEAAMRGIIIDDPIFYGKEFAQLRLSESHMTLVFFNLIHNAVKYSWESTNCEYNHIRIIGEPSEKFYSVSIINYGSGILPNEIENGLIFKDGYRGKLSMDRSRTGSGLGLGIVKKIIEDHGGIIRINSDLAYTNSIINKKNVLYKNTINIQLPLDGRISK
jgi:signal transduction histidine kinase